MTELARHCLPIVQPDRLQRRHPVAAQARLRKRGDLRGQLLPGFPGPSARHDSVDEAELQGFGRAHRPPGDDHVQRPAQPDEPRQPDRTAVDERHAPAPAEHAEHRVLLGRPQVAPERELKPASDRAPRDRGDHRLGRPHPGGTYRPVAVRLGPVAVWHMTMSGKIIE